MTTRFQMTRDVNGYNGFGLKFADDSVNVILAATVEQTVTVPEKFNRALAVFGLESGASVWVANNATAVLPTGSFSATPCQLNPVGREVKGGDVLHFITSNANADVGVSFYDL